MHVTRVVCVRVSWKQQQQQEEKEEKEEEKGNSPAMEGAEAEELPGVGEGDQRVRRIQRAFFFLFH